MGVIYYKRIIFQDFATLIAWVNMTTINLKFIEGSLVVT